MAISYEFAANDTLITPQEIVDESPVGPNSYTDQRLPFMLRREEQLFRRYFGIAFYKVLMANRRKYSEASGTGITVYVHYHEGTPYTSGAVVLYKSRLYKATANTTALPSNQSYWKRAERFANDDYNFLWERYLRSIIAFSISNDSLFYRLVSDTPTGLVQRYEEGKSRSLKVTEAGRLKAEYQTDIDDAMAIMDAFIRENKDIYPDYLPLKDCNATNEFAKRRRPKNHGFNTYR
jgi:hypothetical protein